MAGRVIAAHERLGDLPTRIAPLGLLGDARGRALNLRDYALRPRRFARGVPAIGVVGTSMNSGKTRTAASVVKGLTRCGLRVGAVKLTGTGAGGDLWALEDSGARPVLDFTDAGFASTYRVPVAELLACAKLLLGEVAAHGADVVVAEIADGLQQPETAALLASPGLREACAGMVFASEGALGAAAGVARLHAEGYPVLAVSGRLCLSPLALREAREAADVPVLDLETLERPEIAGSFLSLRALTRRLA